MLSLVFNRMNKDTIHQTNLSKFRIAAHKNRRTYDAPIVPPKLFNMKGKLGRVDLTMLLVQECEHRYALERVALLTWMSSRESLVHQAHAKNLNQGKLHVSLDETIYIRKQFF